MDPCQNLMGTVTGKIFTVRSGKELMPFRQGAALTTYMVDYIPPLLTPRFYGGLPGVVSSCSANMFGGATKKYMQNNRNDTLPYPYRLSAKPLYGRLPCDYTPFSDVAMAPKALRWRRLHENPRIRPTNVDRNRACEIELFHERCVNQRDYYLDKTNSLHPDEYFDLGRPYPYRCPVDERIFKIKRAADKCDGPQVLGPPLHCGRMPCIRKNAFLVPFAIPKLPRPPFQCDAIKPKVPEVHEVLLV